MKPTLPSFGDLPVVKAITLAHEQPEVGLGALIELMPALTKEGRDEEAHAVADTVVAVAGKSGLFLDAAERVARDLVEKQPDRWHLEALAKVLELRAKESEAQSFRRRAEAVEDEHLTDELKELFNETRRELGQPPRKF